MNIIKQLQNKIIEFRDKRNWKQFHTPKDLAIAVNIEASELLENFRWDDIFDKTKVKYEVADIFIFLLIFCNEININLEQAVIDKLKINEVKYPVDKFYNSSRKYNE